MHDTKGFIMKFIQGIVGESVIHTLTKACHVAKHERDSVLLEINDVIMYVNKETSLNNLYNKYQQKLNFKYEIERIKRQRQK